MKKRKHLFINKNTLNDLIQAYFNYIEGQYHIEKIPAKKTSEVDFIEQRVWDREAEPATIAGLAFFLGFNSRDEFDEYESRGKFSTLIKRARLRIEAAYEKKLDTSAGAIFVLKNMGRNEKAENSRPVDRVRSIKVKIIESGPQPVASEKEVLL